MFTSSVNPRHHSRCGASFSLACLLMGLGCSPEPGKDDSAPETLECEVAGGTPGARLLTRSEYRRTVAALLATELDPTTAFPAEPEVEGFDNNASSHQANPLLVESYHLAARKLATEAFEGGIDRLVPCQDDVSERTCAERFVDEWMTRAYRRPLSELERRSFLSLYDRASPNLGHEIALATLVEAALQSPQFLYRVETFPSDQDASGTHVLLEPYALASRLSYFLWGSMPDAELRSAAASQELSTPEQVEAQARRMLDDPRAVERVREFHRSWLGLDRFDGIQRSGAPEGAAAAWEESLLLFLDEVFWNPEAKLADLFSSPSVYVDATLAPLYDLDAPGAEGTAFTAYEMNEQRRGLLTQPALTALLSHSEQSSPIQRGVFLRDQILCAPVPAPPANVDNTPPDPDPELTTRERFAVHTEDPTCAGCHRLIDPVGFGFESYDQLGRFRLEENGQPIDTSGELTASPDPDIEGDFASIRELSDRLATSPAVVECIASKWFTFALGRVVHEEDQCSLDAATELMEQTGSLRDLLVGITTSNAFRYRPAYEGKDQ